MDAGSFSARMAPRTVIANADGSFEIWYDVGDLFGGHSIVVTGDVTGGPRRADIEG